jgi:hypothetical protein
MKWKQYVRSRLTQLKLDATTDAEERTGEEEVSLIDTWQSLQESH